MGAASLFSNSGDLDRLHSIISRLAFAGAGVTAVVLGLVGLATGDLSIGIQGTPPGIVAVTVGISLLVRKPNAAFTLAVSAFAVIVAVPIIGTPDTLVGASTAVVLILCFGVLFVGKSAIAYTVIGAIVVGLTPVFWNPEMASETLVTSFVMALSFTVGAVAMLFVREAAVAANDKYRVAFHEAPSALIELDWSAAYRMTHMMTANDEDMLRDLISDVATTASVLSKVRVVRANAAMANMVGLADVSHMPGTIRGRFVNHVFHEAWAEHIVSMWSGEASFAQVFEQTQYGKTRWTQVESVMREDSGSRIALITMTDITDSKLANRQLEETIKAKDDFIASVSHEIRTPLTAVLGLSEELRGADYLTVEERDELLDIVYRQANEMAYIVEDLLVGARSDIGAVSTMKDAIGLRRLTEQLLTELRTDIQFDIPLSVVALGDGVRIRQILRNLIVNSERYGGSDRRILAVVEDGVVSIEVRDSGSPLPIEARTRVFGAYESAHETKGTTAAMGLGLNVSRTLARLMDGDLVYDHDGEAIFRLTLPSADAAIRVERRSIERAGLAEASAQEAGIV